MSIISAEGLTRKIGQTTLLDDVSLFVEQGQFCALTGAAGSGKTTLMDILAGLTVPASGSVQCGNGETKVGYVPDLISALPNLTALQNMKILAKAFSIKDLSAPRKCLETCGLSNWSYVRVRSFSLPMLKRLGLAMALLKDPDVFLIDEPFRGSDEQTRADIAKIFRKLKADGKTILVSTDKPSELAPFADTYVMLENGHLKDQKAKSDMMDGLLTAIRLTVGSVDKAREVLNFMEIFGYQVPDQRTVLLMERFSDIDMIVDALNEGGAEVHDRYPVYDTTDSYM